MSYLSDSVDTDEVDQGINTHGGEYNPWNRELPTQGHQGSDENAGDAFPQVDAHSNKEPAAVGVEPHDVENSPEVTLSVLFDLLKEILSRLDKVEATTTKPTREGAEGTGTGSQNLPTVAKVVPGMVDFAIRTSGPVNPPFVGGSTLPGNSAAPNNHKRPYTVFAQSPTASFSPNDEPTSRVNQPGSEFRRGMQKEVAEDENSMGTENALLPKKLMFSPRPAHKPDSQFRKVASQFVDKGKGLASDEIPRKSKKNNHTLPRFIKSKFKPSADMKLNLSELQICAYVFGRDKCSFELMFKVGNISYGRGDFECLCPGKIVGEEIITMTALEMTWTQKNNYINTIWCLPPAFAEDVKMGCGIPDLVSKYAMEWMPPFTELSHIYIPIEEIGSHWYLMVLHVHDEAIYTFDSYASIHMMRAREHTMRTVANALNQMIQTEHYPANYLRGAQYFGHWPIIEARGIPNCGGSDDSALWVISWLRMGVYFTHRVIGVLKDRGLRMRVALDLIMGAHNELRDDVDTSADIAWRNAILNNTI